MKTVKRYKTLKSAKFGIKKTKFFDFLYDINTI